MIEQTNEILASELCSLHWLNELSSGLFPSEIEINFNSLNIAKTGSSFEVYLGPANPNEGVDGLMILLDSSCNLIEYIIERIEPAPHLESD